MQPAKLEETLSEFVTGGRFEELPSEAIFTARNVVLTNLGTIIAGALVSGIEPLVNQVRDWGGKPEATILMHGGRIPAYNAGFINGVMARALDFDDAGIPGIHIGASAVSTALAVAELIGGCSGREFLTALSLGIEVTARLNLREEQYNGFCPTGVCSVFATAAVAGRLLGLTRKQMLNALALAFIRSAGSFQSNIDGSLGVRLTQGFVSQNGIICAQLARIGMTGPENFLSGIYGYFHLYGKGKDNTQAILDGLGKRFEFVNIVFKKYPSCGATQACTDAILALTREHGLSPDEIESVDVHVTPGAYRLAGKPFKVGDNPKVDAQFSIQYCVASALLRKCSTLEHFDEAAIMQPEIYDILENIHVFSDPALDARGHTAMSMQVKTRGGHLHSRTVDIAIGFPGNPLTQEDHINRFHTCIEYAAGYFPRANAGKIVSLVENLEAVEDIRVLIPLLLRREAVSR